MTIVRKDANIRTRHRGLLVASALSLVVGFLPAFLVTFGLRPLSGLPLAAVASAMPGYFLACMVPLWFWNKMWLERRGELRADETGIYLDGRRIAKRKTFLNGYVHSEGGRMFLRLMRSAPFARPIDVVVDDAEQATQLLAALRLDAQSSVAEYEMAHGTVTADKRRSRILGATSFTLLGIAFIQFMVGARLDSPHHHHFPLFATIAFAFYVMAASVSLAAAAGRVVRVWVGADGVSIKHGVYRKRFIPFADIREVTLHDRELTLTLADDTSLPIHHSERHTGRNGMKTDREGEARGLYERIRERLDAVHNTAQTTVIGVGRNGRSTNEWIRDAAAVREQSATYRTQVVPDDQLWRIVEDAGAAPTDRTGAALALRSDLDESGRARLRIAAGACAAKELRVALESVATTEDDADLARHLEPLEERRAMSLRAGL